MDSTRNGLANHEPVNGTNGPANGQAEHQDPPPAPRQVLNLQVVWGRLKKLEAEVHADKAEPPKSEDAPLLGVILAVVAGCTTPVLALCMSTLTGTVARMSGQAAWFALLPAGVLACMLVVSTPHIAEAKLTLGWAPWQAWAFACGLDCAIVVSELLSVWCHVALADVWWLPQAVILGSVIYSAALNSYVNLLHAGWSWVADPRSR